MIMTRIGLTALILFSVGLIYHYAEEGEFRYSIVALGFLLFYVLTLTLSFRETCDEKDG